MKTFWKSGSWNAICDICARKYKAEELIRNWRGQMVCREDFETRNEQELIRPIKDMNKLPWTRPRGTDQFINSCTPEGTSSIADLAVADCSIANLPYPNGTSCTSTGKMNQADLGTANCATIV